MGLTPFGTFVRSWLANRSEWCQRDRPDVARPLLTLLHLVVVFPAADEVAVGRGVPWQARAHSHSHSGDEAKASSWGRFGHRWLLIDYDRAWESPRGFVGGRYYLHQERLARRWAREYG